jgi:hypothetical protein
MIIPTSFFTRQFVAFAASKDKVPVVQVLLARHGKQKVGNNDPPEMHPIQNWILFTRRFNQLLRKTGHDELSTTANRLISCN